MFSIILLVLISATFDNAAIPMCPIQFTLLNLGTEMESWCMKYNGTAGFMNVCKNTSSSNRFNLETCRHGESSGGVLNKFSSSTLGQACKTLSGKPEISEEKCLLRTLSVPKNISNVLVLVSSKGVTVLSKNPNLERAINSFLDGGFIVVFPENGTDSRVAQWQMNGARLYTDSYEKFIETVGDAMQVEWQKAKLECKYENTTSFYGIDNGSCVCSRPIGNQSAYPLCPRKKIEHCDCQPTPKMPVSARNGTLPSTASSATRRIKFSTSTAAPTESQTVKSRMQPISPSHPRIGSSKSTRRPISSRLESTVVTFYGINDLLESKLANQPIKFSTTAAPTGSQTVKSRMQPISPSHPRIQSSKSTPRPISSRSKSRVITKFDITSEYPKSKLTTEEPDEDDDIEEPLVYVEDYVFELEKAQKEFEERWLPIINYITIALYLATAIGVSIKLISVVYERQGRPWFWFGRLRRCLWRRLSRLLPWNWRKNSPKKAIKSEKCD